MKLSKEQVIGELCPIVSLVGRLKYDSSIMHDCFCSIGGYIPFEGVSSEIIEYIREAVSDRLKSEGH